MEGELTQRHMLLYMGSTAKHWRQRRGQTWITIMDHELSMDNMDCSCLNCYLLASLVRCALLIAVIFLHLGPVLLYPRTGHLQLWVLHFGMILLLHSGV